jgi:hypothetical protein
MNTYKMAVGLLAGLLGLWACGGAAVPYAQSAETEGAVRAAAEVGASNVPQGALHLKLAQDQIVTANKLIADGENEKADMVLRRAEADAETALALAKAESARQEAEAAKQRIEELRQRQRVVEGS